MAVSMALCGGVEAQSVAMLTDSSRVEIGNPFTIRLEVAGSAKPDSIHLEDWAAVVPKEDLLAITGWQQANGKWLAALQLLFFDSGTVVLPPLRVGSGTTDSLKIEVYPMPLADTATLAPIKDIIEAPPAPAETAWWPWLLLICAGLAGLLAFWYWRKRSPRQRNRSEPIPTDEWRARFLALKKTIPTPQQKEFYAELSALLRNWLERNQAIQALERTTSEILVEVQKSKVLDGKKDAIAQILQTSDLVKFANATPELSEQQRLYDLLEKITHD